MTTKNTRTPEMSEGTEAFNRFREAVKIIVAVPKQVIVETEAKERAAKKRLKRR